MRKRKNYYRPYEGRRTPLWLKLVLALILAGAAAFLILFFLVLSGARDVVRGEPAVMVIPGCQVREDGPSALLQDRLDRALEYLADHPDMTVVVCGGQGPDEPVTEAQAMYDYLTARGVAGENILLEDRSHNTWENIRYSQEVLRQAGLDTDQVLVVSNGFHLTRVRMLWARAWEGEYTLSTLAAPSSHIPSRLKMYIREPIALVKSFVFDR